MKILVFIVSTVLPQVIAGTIISLIIGTVVGGLIGTIVGAISRRQRATLIPAILGSALGVLIVAILPLLSQPGVLQGGGYAGIILQLIVFFLLPLGSTVGGVIGSIVGLMFSGRLALRTGWISFFAIYLLSVAGFYLIYLRNS